MSEPLWIALRFPALPLQALFSPAQCRRALAVSRDHRVLVASTAAHQAGVRAGMRIATARALCRELEVHEHDPSAQHRRLYELGEQLLCLTPATSLRPPDGLLLEVGGCLKLFGGLPALLDALYTELENTSLDVCTGLASTAEAAWQFTHLPAESSLATVSAGRIDRERFLALLEGLPLETLDVEEALRRKLLRPGFRTLGELLALPRPTLGRRFGGDFPRWLDRLRGDRPDPRTPLLPAEPFSGEREFSEPVACHSGLLQPMEALLTELMSFLQRRGQYTRAIRWQFHDHRGRAEPLLIRRSQPDQAVPRWMLLTRRRLESCTLRAPVLRLTLDCEPARQAREHSGDLLADPAARPDARALLEELATLPGLHCYRPGRPESHLPESPHAVPDPSHTGETPFPPRPLWLLQPPRALTEHHNRPCWRGKVLELLPEEERIHGDWWQQPAYRQYRYARHPHGWFCWVFHERGKWWLHGIF